MALTNLRERAESDLEHTLEGSFALPVILISPDGLELSVTGQVLYDTVKDNPETGAQIVVNHPAVTLRRSSLSQVPLPGERWFVKIPTSPSETGTLIDFVIDSDRPPEGGTSIGFIRLYLRKAEQTP